MPGQALSAARLGGGAPIINLGVFVTHVRLGGIGAPRGLPGKTGEERQSSGRCDALSNDGTDTTQHRADRFDDSIY